MKLLIAIVSKDDVQKVIKNLVNSHFFVTKLASTGGFLRGGNVTLMIGTPADRVDEAMKIFEDFSKSRTKIVPNQIMHEYGAITAMPVEVIVGGATIFVIDVEKYKKI